MALFGNLNEIPFSEMVGVLSRRTGRLEIDYKEDSFEGGSQISMMIHQGSLKNLFLNNVMVDGVMEVREVFRKLIITTTGSFEFTKVPETLVEGPFDISLKHAVATLTDHDQTKDQLEEKLPDSRTRFTTVKDASIWLDEELDGFWKETEELF